VERWKSFVRELATNRELTTQLLITHVRTGEGLCAACTRSGQGIPCEPWPCSMWLLAEAARKFRGTLGEGDDRAGRSGLLRDRER
jgi:hypothetical protein